MLLRSTSLRNTEFVYGLVIYTGHNTKIMKNSIGSRNKVSKMEKLLNIQILYVFFLQMFICLFGAIYGTVMRRDIAESTDSYL